MQDADLLDTDFFPDQISISPIRNYTQLPTQSSVTQPQQSEPDLSLPHLTGLHYGRRPVMLEELQNTQNAEKENQLLDESCSLVDLMSEESTHKRRRIDVLTDAKKKVWIPGPANQFLHNNAAHILQDQNSQPDQHYKSSHGSDVQMGIYFRRNARVEDFDKSIPWAKMLKNFEIDITNSRIESLVAAGKGVFGCNIAWVLEEKYKETNHKIALLVVMVQSLKHMDNDIYLVVKDPWGAMPATVHVRVCEDFPTQIQVGSVLVLKNVAVFSPTKTSHTLNITRANVLTVFHDDTQQ